MIDLFAGNRLGVQYEAAPTGHGSGTCKRCFLLFTDDMRTGGSVIMKLFLCLLGLVLVIEGIPYFACPDRMKRWIGKIREVPDNQLRIMGFFAMCTGLILAYVFRS
jgi:uncharacterized protein YjeT (DUF2065 family)